ncbi:MAG TPA: hypothetical protein GX529_03530 [Firmicutes bacterium]|nr:hypothetical protein [Candidatus Fermentithermobacillaceae bacterium]
MWKKAGVVLSLVLAVALFMAGCTPKVDPEPADVRTVGGSITYGMSGDPVIFNPILYTDSPSSFVIGRVYSGLVRANEDLEMIPDLAESWSFSDDGLVWTFKLREDARFHDGEPLTSADVKYTYDAIKHPDYTGIRATNFRSVEKIEAPDPYTVVFYLSEPFAPMITYLGYGILPKHIFEQTSIKEMKENEANMEPVGTGPYKFVEWQRGQHLILEANEDYYGEGPFIEQVIIKFYQDEQVMLAALEKGDIDYMGSIPPDDIERVVAEYSDRLEFAELPANGYTYIGLKQNHPILKDVTVRKALVYGLNRHAIVDDILLGYGTVMNANIPPVSWAYAEGELEDYAYNPEKAKELLEGAGWVEGPDGIRVKDGERLSFTLITDSGSKLYESIMMIVQEDWENIGVEMKPEFIEWSVLCDQYLDVAQFEAYMLGWSLGLDPDFFNTFHSAAAVDEEGNLVGFNDVEFKSERLDELLEDGRREMDQEKRKEIYVEAQRIINDELPYVFLYTRNYVAAIDKKIKGVVWSTLGPMFPEKWYIEE